MPGALSCVERKRYAPLTVGFSTQPDTDRGKNAQRQKVLASGFHLGGSVLLARVHEQPSADEGLLHFLQTPDADVTDLHEAAGLGVEFDIQDTVGRVLIRNRRVHLREGVTLILERGQ